MNYEKYIDDVCSAFKTLISEQLERQDRMEGDSAKKDFTAMDKVVIGTVGGDGIGPIITEQAVRILNKLLENEISAGKIEIRNIEGLTLENRLALNKSVPDDVLAKIKSCDVLLKGPTTTPNGGNMESANVTLRRELDLFANVRPISLPDEEIDWTFFRENTEGEYVLGSRGIEIPGKLSMDFKVTTKSGTERIARAAFDFAKKNGKNRLTLITKANILKKTDGYFSEICHEMAKEYPGIEVEEYYIDIMTANLLKKATRNKYQVFLAPNLYGDIITDEAAEIQGGIGTAGSANIGDRYAMFEAIHGSAVRMIEEGRSEYTDPSSIIKASEMMIRHLGLSDKADRLKNALEKTSSDSRYKVTGRSDGIKGSEFADRIMELI